MVRATTCLIWVAKVAVSLALDTAATYGPYLINNATNSLLTINGIWYSTSNSTTDVYKMDPLIDAEVCTRDAALMHRLGINTIYVTSIDAAQNHDACFSIFNSVGIYVVVVFRGGSDWIKDLSAMYTTDLMKDTFEIIDAIKDYENLMAVDVGTFPSFGLNPFDSYAEAMLLYRTFIRDTKEYIARNSARPILTGVTLFYEALRRPISQWFFDYLQCAIDGPRNDFSQTDYIGWVTLILVFESARTNATTVASSLWANLTADVQECTVPIWLSRYDTLNIDNSTTSKPGSLDATELLFNMKNQHQWQLAPNGLLNGGSRDIWANVGQSGSVEAALPNMVVLDSQGNIQLTDRYDRFQAIFSHINTEAFLSEGGSTAATWVSNFNYTLNPPKCEEKLLANATLAVDTTLAMHWSMPTRPAGLDAIITSGAGGTRGQMVDVTVTAIAYTIKDSSGTILTDISLEPSKSSARSTTRAASTTATSTATPKPASALSTAAIAGIAVSAAVGGLALIGAGLFWFLRRKSKKKAAVRAKVEEQEKSEMSSESSRLPEMEVPPGELPAVDTAHELCAARERRGDTTPLQDG